MVELDLHVAAQDVGVLFECFSGNIGSSTVLGATNLGVIR